MSGEQIAPHTRRDRYVSFSVNSSYRVHHNGLTVLIGNLYHSYFLCFGRTLSRKMVCTHRQGEVLLEFDLCFKSVYLRYAEKYTNAVTMQAIWRANSFFGSVLITLKPSERNNLPLVRVDYTYTGRPSLKLNTSVIGSLKSSCLLKASVKYPCTKSANIQLTQDTHLILLCPNADSLRRTFFGDSFLYLRPLVQAKGSCPASGALSQGRAWVIKTISASFCRNRLFCKNYAVSLFFRSEFDQKIPIRLQASLF